jgi:hypothetical protein
LWARPSSLPAAASLAVFLFFCVVVLHTTKSKYNYRM